MSTEHPTLYSKVKARLEETPSGEPRCWVEVQRPGATRPEEYSYAEIMGIPAVIDEDRAVKQEVQRQQRALMREWKSKPQKEEMRTSTFEILDVQSDRSPHAAGFDPTKHMTVYYKLDGRERTDTPGSLNKAILSHPERYPTDARALIAKAVREKEKSLREQCKPPEMSASEPKAEEVPIPDPPAENVPTAMPEASAGGEDPPKTVALADMPPSIPPQLRDSRIRFVKVCRWNDERYDRKQRGKAPIEEDWGETGNHPHNDPGLLDWIARGGNYGVVCGHVSGGLVAIDADRPEVAAAVDERLPRTFKVRSGRSSSEGFHYYFWCPDLELDRTIALDTVEGNVGHIKSTGGQIIGPGSTHNTGTKYRVCDDMAIAEVKSEVILEALIDFLPAPKVDSVADLAEQEGIKENSLNELRVQDIIDTSGFKRQGNELVGATPWHDSDTGTNLHVNPDENLWHCFRHGTGGNPYTAIAVKEGVIKCEDCVRHALSRDQFKQVLAIAQEKYGFKRVRLGKTDGSLKDIVDHAAEQVDSLIRLAKQDGRALLFHDAGAVPYARLEVRDHYEVKAIREQDFSEWIKYKAVKATGRAPKKDPLNQAIDTIAVLARFEGEEREVYIRKGEHEGTFYYDLCNDQWQAVRITSEGWQVVDDPPVMFRRFDTMRPQVVPRSGRPKALDEMVQLINTSEEMRQLLKYHLTAFNVPNINHYNAFFLGPQGSSKSTGNDVVKAIDDPGTDNRDSLPPREDDLDLHLSRRCTAAYDNISKINQEISDKLTRANSMGRSSRRALYTNNDENSRRYRTKIVLNAIGLDDGVRPDLLDRTIIYNCEVVTESQRLGQEEVNARIEELRPYALGVALDLLVRAIPIYHELKERRWKWAPRLKDAYLWMMAIAKVDGMSEEKFEELFKRVIDRRDSDAIEGDPLAVAVEHVANMKGFVGTANQLHEWLNDPGLDIPRKCHIEVRDKSWPKGGIALGIHLPRIIAPLRSRGVYVYQCYFFELDKTFTSKIQSLEWKSKVIGDYRNQDKMIIISKDDIKRTGTPEARGR